MLNLECIVCGRKYPADDRLTCLVCGPAEGIMDVIYDYESAASTMTPKELLSREASHWRYRELLPLTGPSAVPLHVGWTPVYETPRLAKEVGAYRLFLKDDGRNPTASFKDRASSVGVAKAVEFSHAAIACASTGNAASSLAGCAASVGLRSYIFVPERAPEPKVAQLLLFGATVLRVRGTYDQAYDLCMEAAGRYGWYNRNCAVNPYLVEGKKTAGLEIAEQCGDSIPDWVAVSVGDGCTIAGVWKGLREMHRLGFIPRLPRLLAVQAQGSPAVARQFCLKGEPPLVTYPADTVADSICVGVPRNWRKAVRAVRESGGTFVLVSDEAIMDALRYTPRLSGVFGEPAGVTAVAGVAAARQDSVISPNESVLAVITGNGLKDIMTAMQAAGQPFSIDPNLDELEKIVGPAPEPIA